MGIRFIAINDGYDSSKEVQNGTDLDIQFRIFLMIITVVTFQRR